MSFRFRIVVAVALLWPCAGKHAAEPHRADVVIYGGTSAGVAAALQVSRMGKSVVVIEPTDHLGGLTTNGLGATDSGRKETIGGISREFYRRIQDHYRDPASWNLQKADEPSEKNGRPLFDPKANAMWVFEPKVAQKIMDAFAAESGATLVFEERLDRANGVAKKDGRIVSIAMESRRVFEGGMFLDATYEGDLLAAAGVGFHVG
ncbi:MAG: FAD-dependent oxidoreductase, partial [Verrucomicrobia bacterium]|nr:FAD-dependent oxidoreductase [Verrucomicrobiota bacterium]